MNRRFAVGGMRRGMRSGVKKAGGGGPLVPATIPGLEAWYDPENYAGGVALDLSGHGRDLSAVGTAPAVVAEGGALAWQFDGTGHLRADFGLTLSQPMTVYLAFRPTALDATETWYDGIDITNRVQLYTDATPVYHFRAINDLSGGTPTLAPHATCHIANGASGAAFVDDFVAPMQSGTSGSSGIAGLSLGGNYGNGQRASGYVFSFLLYSTAHDAATRKLVGDYLANRYSIPIVT